MMPHLRKSLKRLFLAALVAASAVRGARPAAEDSGALAEGVITEARGRAEVQNGPGVSRPARPGGLVAGGEIIVTGADGRVKLTLVDRSLLEVRPNSRVQINDSRLNPRGVSSVLIYVGWLWAKVTTHAVNEYAFEVEAATAVAGVRGTELMVAAAEDGDTRVAVVEGRAVMENESGAARLERGQVGEAGYERPPAAAGVYSERAEFWLGWLNQHHLALFSEMEIFVMKMVAAVLDARAKLLERDREFREAWEEFEQAPPPAPRPADAEKEEVEPGPPAPEPETKTREQAATAVSQLYRKAREVQKEAHRLESNYYLAEQARRVVTAAPEKFRPAQVQAVNQNLARIQDIPRLRDQSRLALHSYAVVLESQVSKYQLAPLLGRLPPLERNAQIQQILKQIPGAMPKPPTPQSMPKPVMPPAPMPPRP